MLEAVLSEIERVRQERETVVVAIDGRCASGKTSLAGSLQKALDCSVFHMDEFFLRPEQRTRERYEEPGGNVDWERFKEEVLQHVLNKESFSYRPFDCHTMTLKKAVDAEPTAVTVIEGTYSCHPRLWDSYDLHIFLNVAPEEQLLRIRRRNGKNAKAFQERWIPLEERYFAACEIENRCELCFVSKSI